MKSKIFMILTAVVVVATMSSCDSSSSSKIDYLPCKVDKSDDWGFVNAKGEVFCRDMFKNEPTEVRDGIFFIEEGGAYAMYRFDQKKPKLLLDDILHYGRMHDGLVPICKKDAHIEIVDNQGKTKFTLTQLNGKEVSSCCSEFEFGYLLVLTTDDEGYTYYGLVDKSGNMVLAPKYKYVSIYGEDLFYVQYEDGDNYVFINKKGEKQSQWKKDMSYYTSENCKYIIGERDSRYYIYNRKGEEILKCPSKVQNIYSLVKNDMFVFRGDDYDLGVMNMKGEVVIPAKYSSLSIVDNGFIVKRDSKRDYELLDKSGELVSTFEDYEYMGEVENFGNIGMEGDNSYYILDGNFKPASKTEFYTLSSGYYSYVESDFFDYDAVIEAVEEALDGELNRLDFGTRVTWIDQLTDQGTDAFSSYSYNGSYELAKGNRYTIYATLTFDNYILSAVYKQKEVTRYDYYYGYYYTTKENEFDGYEFNSNAELQTISVYCDVPYSKQDQMRKKLDSFLDDYASEDYYGNYIRYGRSYSLDGTTITIMPESAQAATSASQVEAAVEEVAEEGWW